MRRSTFHPTLACLAALVASLAGLAPASLACRYSVRDTGFVDLDQPPWLLRLVGLDDARREPWQQAALLRLRDSNIRLDAESTPGSPEARLVDARRRTLALAAGDQLPSTPAEITRFLDRIALSDARDRLHEQLLRAFAVVVLVEGTDPAQAAASRRTVEKAIQEFTPLLKSLPKPVDTPPRLFAIPAERLESERILVWSLGFDPSPTPGSRAAVLYGRGRLAGTPLDGPLITRTALAESFALIGQDCECDLDRSLLQGHVIPARWDTARQSAAAKLLGFDPENPLVRTEVTRIVLRGAQPGGGRRTATTALDTLSLGYSEEAVTPSPDSADAPSIAPIPPILPLPPTPTAAPPPPPAPARPAAPSQALPLWLLLSGAGVTALLGGLWILARTLRSR